MEQLGADGVYSFMERFGGLTSTETKKLFENFKVATERFTMDNIDESDKVSEKNYKAFADATKTITDLYQYLDLDNGVTYFVKMKGGSEEQLNLTEMISYEFSEATGISFEEAKKALETGEFSKIRPDFSKANQWYNSSTAASMMGMTAGVLAIKSAASAASATAAGLIGAAGGSSAVPVVGWVVAGVALLAALGFTITGAVEERKSKAEAVALGNEQEGNFKRKFDQLAVQSASVAYELRRQALDQK